MKNVGNAAQLAAILEVSAPKPGNVNPEHDFKDTRYEDFLLGAIAIGPAIELAAEAGFKSKNLSEIGIGKWILKAIEDVRKSHPGGNTHLGMIMLMVPIAAATGICLANRKELRTALRRNIVKVVENSTPEDSLHLYSAIEKARVGAMGKLVKLRKPFHEIMKMPKQRDRISEELCNGMGITFEFILPRLQKYWKMGAREAIIQTYLETLAEFPDTFIGKKVGWEKTEWVSGKAREVLDGKLSMKKFDQMLRSPGNELNPGTTADLIAAGIMIHLLYQG